MRYKIKLNGVVVYTSSTPRCGTSYISHMFGRHPHCVTSHEPLQRIKIFIDGRKGSKHEVNLKNLEEKWRNLGLKRTIKNTYRKKVYVESDFLFLEATYYFAMKYIDHECIRVIELTRDPIDAIKSICEHKIFRYKNNMDIYLARVLSPYNPFNLTIPPDNPSTLELGAWYIYEMEERKKRFKEVFPDVRVFNFNMDTDTISLKKWDQLANFVGIKLNDKMIKEIKKNPKIHSSEQFKCTYYYDKKEIECIFNNYKVRYKGNRPIKKGIL